MDENEKLEHHETKLTLSKAWDVLKEISDDIADSCICGKKETWSMVIQGGFVLWFIIRFVISILPIMRSITILSKNMHVGTVFGFEIGLIIWYLCLQCLSFFSFTRMCYRYYYNVFYTTLIPHRGFGLYNDFEDVRQEYFRGLKSIAVRKVLNEYFNRDVSNIILFYHDNTVQYFKI